MERGKDFLKFLGTGGARVVVFKQLRASGGLWLELKGKRLLIDPGPGALLRALSSRPRLDPTKLDAIILTHRHLDHSADVNVMIEAMTEGGWHKRGVLFCPQDALEDDPVVLRYLRNYLKDIQILKEGGTYKLDGLTFRTPLRHLHDVETYGLIIEERIGLISDTFFFPALFEAYKGLEILVINVVRAQERDERIKHLTIPDVKEILRETKPQKAILTHFGMTILKIGPSKLAQELSRELGLQVIAATDGMSLNL